MKKDCIIASYGGSGSTFLADILKRCAGDTFNIRHVHGVPQEGFLGAPVFNRLTSHNEGPFSRSCEMRRDSKVILIYRDPAEAYLSRCSYKHFCHIWSETDWMEEVMHEGSGADLFNRQWRLFQDRGEDILNLREFLSRWRLYAEKERHDILFVKYESLKESWSEILNFLGIGPYPSSDIEEFSPRPREIPSRVQEMFKSLSGDLSSWPSTEVFKARDFPQDMVVNNSVQCLRDRLKGNSFTVTGLDAGASDAIHRLALVYDVVKYTTNLEFVLPEYVNYHSPDFDFFEAFGIDSAFRRDAVEFSGAHSYSISLSDFIFHCLHDPSSLPSGVNYIISADVYENDFRVFYLRGFFDDFSLGGFFKRLKYSPQRRIFSDSRDVFKVVFHLRRQDISAAYLFAGVSNVSDEMRRGIHSRPLLSLDEAVNVALERAPQGVPIEVFVLSDGVAKLRDRFSGNEGILKNIDEMEGELEKSAVSDCGRISVIGRSIGNSARNTLISLDAMSQADLVITGSSSFPNLLCRVCGVKLIHVY